MAASLALPVRPTTVCPVQVGLDMGEAVAEVHPVTRALEYRGKVLNRAARIADYAAAGQVKRVHRFAGTNLRLACPREKQYITCDCDVLQAAMLPGLHSHMHAYRMSLCMQILCSADVWEAAMHACRMSLCMRTLCSADVWEAAMHACRMSLCMQILCSVDVWEAAMRLPGLLHRWHDDGSRRTTAKPLAARCLGCIKLKGLVKGISLMQVGKWERHLQIAVFGCGEFIMPCNSDDSAN
jgi:hypothetical protein